MEAALRDCIERLAAPWRIAGSIAIHETATVEANATLKAPLILGPRTFVAAGAYLRGGVFLDEDVIVGPACEIKSCVLLRGSKAAHLSFIGDSVIGADVNIEAGAVIANFRNERAEKRIRIRRNGAIIDTGADKFGAMIGDGARIGANAVIAPGAIIEQAQIVPRLALVDQAPAD